MEVCFTLQNHINIRQTQSPSKDHILISGTCGGLAWVGVRQGGEAGCIPECFHQISCVQSHTDIHQTQILSKFHNEISEITNTISWKG